MADGREYELKLDVGPHEIARLRALASLGTPAAPVRLVSTYFDTADGLLKGAKVVLRVRHSRAGFVHTLKRTGASIVDREEWEQDSARATPDPDWLRSTPLRRLFETSVVQALVPRFTVDVYRSIYHLSHDGAEIEGALDRGVIHVAERSVAGRSLPVRSLAVNEFELELKHGRPEAVLSLARLIAEEVPIALSLASKSERGYALADASWGVPRKELALDLRKGMALDEVFATIVQGCLHLVLVNAALLDSQDDSRDRNHVEAVHKARVALRRLRAGLHLFAPMIRRRWRRSLDADVKWMSRTFGLARDADVFLEQVLDQAAPDAGPGDEELIAVMVAQRRRARTKLRQALDSPRWRMACLDLVEASSHGLKRHKRHKPFRRIVAKQFGRRHRALAKTLPGLEDMSSDDKHEVRKSAKMLRYGLDFFGARPKLVARKRSFLELRDELQVLQQTLGTIHDREALRAHLHAITASHDESDDGRAVAAARRAVERASAPATELRRAAKAARRVRRSKAF